MSRRSGGGIWHVIGGAGGAGIATIIGQPFDVIKTNMIGVDASKVIKNPIRVVSTVVRTQGFWGLYKGVVPTTIRVFPAAGLYFYLIHVFRQGFYRRNKTQELTKTQNFLVGFLSRSIAAFTFNPIFVVKTRFEYNLDVEGSVVKTFKEMIKNRQLFSGVASAVLRDAPYAGLMYMFYSKINRLFAKMSGLSLQAVSFPASCVASITAVSITHPFDVLRTRCQLQPGGSKMNLAEAFTSVLREDGPRGFFRGYIPRVSKKAIVTSLCWTIYELVINKFAKHTADKV